MLLNALRTKIGFARFCFGAADEVLVTGSAGGRSCSGWAGGRRVATEELDSIANRLMKADSDIERARQDKAR